MKLNRRQLIGGAVAVSACGTPPATPADPADPGPAPRPEPPPIPDPNRSTPNVVVLMADQWRYDVIAALGHPVVRTPNADRLIAEGITFREAFTPSPNCKPARVSWMTGRYASELGVMGNGDPIDPSWPSHVRRVRDEAGYLTALVGKAHLTTEIAVDTADDLAALVTWGFTDAVEVPGDREGAMTDNDYRRWLRDLPVDSGVDGFEARWLDWMGEYDDRVFRKREWAARPISDPPYDFDEAHTPDHFIAETAVAWLQGVPADRPFYLQVNFPGPHPPWNAPDDGSYDPFDPAVVIPEQRLPGQPWSRLIAELVNTMGLPTTDDDHRRTQARYNQRVTLVDRGIGLVLEALEAAGRLDDTWIVLTSDHGEMLGDKSLLGKVVMFRPSVQVPLVVRPPGGVQGWSTDAMVSHVDLAQTVLQIAGLDPEDADRGRSLLPVIDGHEDPADRSDVVIHSQGHAAIRTRDQVLVVDEAAGVPVELYDLGTDPDEWVNRVDDPALAQVQQSLIDLLAERTS